MKKLFACLMVLVLALSSAAALAEWKDFDVSQFKTDDYRIYNAPQGYIQIECPEAMMTGLWDEIEVGSVVEVYSDVFVMVVEDMPLFATTLHVYGDDHPNYKEIQIFTDTDQPGIFNAYVFDLPLYGMFRGTAQDGRTVQRATLFLNDESLNLVKDLAKNNAAYFLLVAEDGSTRGGTLYVDEAGFGDMYQRLSTAGSYPDGLRDAYPSTVIMNWDPNASH